MNRDDEEALLGDHRHRGLEVFNHHNGGSVGAVDEEGRLAVTDSGPQIHHLACAEAPQLFDGHLAPRLLARGAIARVADGSLLATALFIIGWLALFGSEYAKAGVGAGSFTLDLIRPLADLIALGTLLAFAARAGLRGLAPGLATCHGRG